MNWICEMLIDGKWKMYGKPDEFKKVYEMCRKINENGKYKARVRRYIVY